MEVDESRSSVRVVVGGGWDGAGVAAGRQTTQHRSRWSKAGLRADGHHSQRADHNAWAPALQQDLRLVVGTARYSVHRYNNSPTVKASASQWFVVGNTYWGPRGR